MYNLDLIRVLAYDIASKNPGLYKLNNGLDCLSNVPFNVYLNDTSVLEQYCKTVLLSMNPNAKIHIIEDGYTEVSVIGGYYELHNNYHIIVNPNHNTCWCRFALIKELCSLYTNHYGRVKGEKKLQTFDDYEKSVENSYLQSKLISENGLDKDDLESDTFAILLATEIMIPPTKRKLTDALLQRVEKKEMTMNDVAQSLSMPEFMLQKLVELEYYHPSCDYYTEQIKNASAATVTST